MGTRLPDGTARNLREIRARRRPREDYSTSPLYARPVDRQFSTVIPTVWVERDVDTDRLMPGRLEVLG